MKVLAIRSPSNGASATKQKQPAAHPVSVSPQFIRPSSTIDSPGLQRKAACACGGGCPRCRDHANVQTKPATNAPADSYEADPYEQEADRVAEQVMSMADPVGAAPPIGFAPHSAPMLRRKCAACEADDEGELHSEETAGGVPRPAPEVAEQVDSLSGRGEPLSQTERAFFEPRFNHDFTQVRVHSGPAAGQSARALRAKAYTVGHDIVFGEGQFAPGTRQGRGLIAHELTHVVQQSQHDSTNAGQGCENGARPPREMTSIVQGRSAAGSVQLAPDDDEGVTKAPPAGQSAVEECPQDYEPGERAKSKQDPGVLLWPVSWHALDTLLIADFAVNWRHLKESQRQDLELRNWMQAIGRDAPDEIHILGYSDCVGEKSNNKVLRIGRARSVAEMMGASIGGAGLTVEAAPAGQFVTDNKDRIGRAMNRGVTIHTKTPPKPPPPPKPTPAPQTPKPGETVCGPDMTDQIQSAIARLKADFDGFSSDEQEELCGTLNSPLSGSSTWDIIQLYHENNEWINEGYRPTCASKGGRPACGETIQVDDQCYYSGTANYVIFGVMCRLCQQNLDEDVASDYDEDHMLELIDFYKGPGMKFPNIFDWDPSGNWQPSRRWAQAGYHGWPNGGTPPAGDRNNCVPMCPTKYWGEPLKTRWCPHIDPGDQCSVASRRRRARRI